jgi:glycosyltransferase involved in cell wall biosynthesis
MIFCGFPEGNQTGVHRFAKEITSGLKKVDPSIQTIYWSKSDGQIFGLFHLMKNFLSTSGKVNVIHFAVMTPVQIPFIILSKFMGKKIVTTYHGDYTRQASIMRRPYLRIAFKISDIVFRNFSNILVSPSQFLFRELNFDSKKCCIIPNPVSVDKFYPSEVVIKRERPDEVIFVTASNFNIKEKVEAMYLFCDAMRTASRELNHVKLLILGDGKYLDQFRSRFKDDTHISILGFKDNIRDYVDQADVYAHFSTFDNQPYAIIDALIRGKVILCNNMKALTEMVDSKNNYVTRLEQLDIVNTIHSIVCDKNNNNSHFDLKGNNNRKKAMDMYSSSNVVSRYLDLYRSLIRS